MRCFPQKKCGWQAGFSLVELLVVASLMAVIGTAALIAINPLELRKRARDNVRFQDAKTLQQAILRYESGENCFPWQKSTGNVCDHARSLTAIYIIPSLFSSSTSYNLSPLIDEGELKNEILQHRSISNGELFISHNSSVGRVSVCFTPESKSGRSGSMGKVMDRTNTLPKVCDNSYAKNEIECAVCVPQL